MYDDLKWFYYLKSTEEHRGLFPDYETDFVVSKQVIENGKVLLKFTSFDSIVSLARWIYLGESKHVYEIIRGDKPLRMFFDIDMKDTQLKQNTREHVNGIIKRITDAIHSITKSDYVVCESLDPEGKKYSFHIIMDCLVASCKHAKELATQTVNLIYDEYISSFIDLGVYSFNRQLRVLGSTKLAPGSKPRFKEWSSLSSVKREEKVPVLNILQTLVSYTSGKKLFGVEIYLPEKEHIYDSIDLKSYNKMLEFIPDFCILRNSHYTDERIDLIRKYPSLCPVCDKKHDSENMFLTLDNNEVLYWCRRNLEKPEILGTLDDSKPVETNTSGIYLKYKEKVLQHHKKRRLIRLN